jgi:myo-inositol-1-phosphate synthase
MGTIKLAIAGVGNCASALVQGMEFYRTHDPAETAGVLHPDLGGYRIEDIQVVCAFDIDARKVGRTLDQALVAPPNCTKIFQEKLPDYEVRVQMGPVLDGVASHMADYDEDKAFRVADAEPVDVAAALRDSGAEVLACYLPVGSEDAVRHYAEACLQAGVALVNCVPVFIASDPLWAKRFAKLGLPVVGDDIKSQVGSTIVHRTLARLLGDRGVQLDHTYQLQAQLDAPLGADDIHIGPSDYVAWQHDNKVAFVRLEWRGFGEVPMSLELRLSVEDSPNSAGVAIDAIRCAKIALDRKIGGPLLEISALVMKHPPEQMRDIDARRALEGFIQA